MSDPRTETVRCQDCGVTGEAKPVGSKGWSVAWWSGVTQPWKGEPLPAWCPDCYETFRQTVTRHSPMVMRGRG